MSAPTNRESKITATGLHGRDGFKTSVSLILVVGVAAISFGLASCWEVVRGPSLSAASSTLSLMEVSRVRDPRHGCGPIAVSLVSRILGRPIPLARATQFLPPDSLGLTDMRRLTQALQAHGFGASGLHIEPTSTLRVRGPLILHLGRAHFAVAVPTSDRTAILLDPFLAPTEYSVSELLNAANGDVILATREPAELLDELRTLGIDSK
jgi:Peptidase C39 family